MALGSKDLSKITSYQVNISSMLREWNDCLNTFQYVTKSLEEWADETVIGNEVRNNSAQLNELLSETIECVNDILSQLTKLVTDQTRINQG